MARAEQEELALSYLDEVHAYARRLTRSAWEAEDLVQATFERALRRSHGLRNPSRMRAWLFRIARNIHIDKIRSVSRRAEIRLADDEPGRTPGSIVPAESVERMTARAVGDALERLSEPQREALLLCDVWGFRYHEIAQITDVAVGTVRSRIARARDDMARQLRASTEATGTTSGGHR